MPLIACKWRAAPPPPASCACTPHGPHTGRWRTCSSSPASRDPTRTSRRRCTRSVYQSASSWMCVASPSACRTAPAFRPHFHCSVARHFLPPGRHHGRRSLFPSLLLFLHLFWRRSLGWETLPSLPGLLERMSGQCGSAAAFAQLMTRWSSVNIECAWSEC